MESIYALSLKLEERLKLALQKLHEYNQIMGGINGGAAEAPSFPVLSSESLKSLTPSQKKILALMTQGLTVKQIADQLNRREKTIYTQRTYARKRLGLKTTDELDQFLKLPQVQTFLANSLPKKS